MIRLPAFAIAALIMTTSQTPSSVVIVALGDSTTAGTPAFQSPIEAPPNAEAHLRGMYDRAARAKIPVVAGSIIPYNTATPEQNAKMHAINAWIRAEAGHDGTLTFVDTRAVAARTDNPDLLAASPDGLHPDVAGYRRVAEALEPALRRLLEAR